MNAEPLMGRMHLVRGNIADNMVPTPSPLIVVYGYTDGGALPEIEALAQVSSSLRQFLTRERRWQLLDGLYTILKDGDAVFFIANLMARSSGGISHLIPDAPVERIWVNAVVRASKQNMQIHWQEPISSPYVDTTNFLYRLFFELVNKRDVDFYYYNPNWPYQPTGGVI